MVSALQSAVQRNCHISDARHAGDYTMCVYLLKMREYFRWEHGFPLHASLPGDALGTWLSDREELWESLEGQAFTELPVNGACADPFDADSINQTLVPQGMVYSGGYGLKSKPLFFLARLERQETCGRYTIYVASDEYARDLAAPPAMSLDNKIYIRRESLRRYLWERIEEWRWNQPDNAMGRAVRCYDFDTDPERALEEITARELDTVLLHEIGEIMAGETLGPDWKTMLAALPPSHAEIMLRSVRDHLADSLSTLPRILEEIDPPVLHFYFANLTSMRRQLCPSLISGYETWNATGSPRELTVAVSRGAEHWNRVARQALAYFRQRGAGAGAAIEALIKDNYL